MRFVQNKPGLERGASFVELAICLPFFVLLILAFFDFTRYLFFKSILDSGAQAAVASAIIKPELADPIKFPDVVADLKARAKKLAKTAFSAGEGTSFAWVEDDVETNLDLFLRLNPDNENWEGDPDLEKKLRESKEPISFTMRAKIKPILPLMREFTIVSVAAGYREFQGAYSMPVPRDCQGNPVGSPDYQSSYLATECRCGGDLIWNSDFDDCRCPIGSALIDGTGVLCECDVADFLEVRDGECRCRAVVDCGPGGTFDPQNCLCTCDGENSSDNDAGKCSCDDNFSPDGASCVCMPLIPNGPDTPIDPSAVDCGVGGNFDASACACACPNDDTIFEEGEDNFDVCACDPGQRLTPNEAGDDCICDISLDDVPEECGLGLSLNEDSCNCDCEDLRDYSETADDGSCQCVEGYLAQDEQCVCANAENDGELDCGLGIDYELAACACDCSSVENAELDGGTGLCKCSPNRTIDGDNSACICDTELENIPEDCGFDIEAGEDCTCDCSPLGANAAVNEDGSCGCEDRFAVVPAAGLCQCDPGHEDVQEDCGPGGVYAEDCACDCSALGDNGELNSDGVCACKERYEYDSGDEACVCDPDHADVPDSCGEGGVFADDCSCDCSALGPDAEVQADGSCGCKEKFTYDETSGECVCDPGHPDVADSCGFGQGYDAECGCDCDAPDLNIVLGGGGECVCADMFQDDGGVCVCDPAHADVPDDCGYGQPYDASCGCDCSAGGLNLTVSPSGGECVCDELFTDSGGACVCDTSLEDVPEDCGFGASLNPATCACACEDANQTIELGPDGVTCTCRAPFVPGQGANSDTCVCPASPPASAEAGAPNPNCGFGIARDDNTCSCDCEANGPGYIYNPANRTCACDPEFFEQEGGNSGGFNIPLPSASCVCRGEQCIPGVGRDPQNSCGCDCEDILGQGFLENPDGTCDCSEEDGYELNGDSCECVRECGFDLDPNNNCKCSCGTLGPEYKRNPDTGVCECATDVHVVIGSGSNAICACPADIECGPGGRVDPATCECVCDGENAEETPSGATDCGCIEPYEDNGAGECTCQRDADFCGFGAPIDDACECQCDFLGEQYDTAVDGNCGCATEDHEIVGNGAGAVCECSDTDCGGGGTQNIADCSCECGENSTLNTDTDKCECDAPFAADSDGECTECANGFSEADAPDYTMLNTEGDVCRYECEPITCKGVDGEDVAFLQEGDGDGPCACACGAGLSQEINGDEGVCFCDAGALGPCPLEGQVRDEQTCVCDCPEGAELSGAGDSCECSNSNMELEGAACVCPLDQADVLCPGETQILQEDSCSCECMPGAEISPDGEGCESCRGNMFVQDGACVCQGPGGESEAELRADCEATPEMRFNSTLCKCVSIYDGEN